MTPRRPLFDGAQTELGLVPIGSVVITFGGIMIGTLPVQQIRFGTIVVSKVYVATTQVWSS